MIIPVTLNGEKVVFDELPSENLLSVLRKRKLLSCKEGCLEGKCGFCSVLVDDRCVPSCKIPVGILRDRKIETLEHFATTDEYWDIASGFESAGVQLCGYCNAATIFAVHNLISDYYRPERNQLSSFADSLVCGCTEKNTLISGILYAIANKHKRQGMKTDE